MQNFATFSKNQLDSFVDLEKPEKMRIWLQNFVSIQPRTSLEKSDVSWPTACCSAQLADALGVEVAAEVLRGARLAEAEEPAVSLEGSFSA